MFIGRATGGYTRDGSQHSRGDFLLVAGGHTFVLDEESGRSVMVKLPLRAAVRFVRLSQLGHWMMGSARMGKLSVTVSGAYGGDGLPMDVEKVPYDTMEPLPIELERAFWAGGGHNSSGSEGPAMRAWAIENIEALRRAGRKS